MDTPDQSVTDRTLCLVSGYHPHTYPPDRVYFQGLRHRFAFVLDTYRRDKKDLYFDKELFLRIVTETCQIIGYDVVEICMTNGARFNSFDYLAQYYMGRHELDNEPPKWIELFRGNQLVGLENTEFWTLVGGPSPYHDSYTISFYTDMDLSKELVGISQVICAEIGACITGFYVAEQDMKPTHWWMLRVFRWLGSVWKRILNK